jgi:hypothetical protein
MAARFREVCCGVALVALLAPLSEAAAAPAPDLALAASLGVSAPLDAAINYDVRLAGLTGAADGTNGRPVIVEHEAAGGVRLGLALQIQEWSVEYALRRYSWAETVGTCEGEGGASVLSNGRIDDIGVKYDCEGASSDFRIDGATSSNLTEHSLVLLVRRPLFDLDWVAGYALYGGGPAARISAIATTQSSFVMGAVVEAGGSLAFPIEERIALQIDGRLGGGIFAATGGPGRAARAKAMGASSYGALLDDLFRADLSAAVRYTLE